ncbi:CDP-diacylglycerol--glycerol-3-phosphate 3-phosphatidyltransferase [Caulobacter sp. Root655]|uniref:CDP-alcohol phosphatidyltransferase family protein n=1 Tax=Caulobacter sp. Root655 TaxID=1736578 RepID=UPI0006FAB701|nr:CDP-alcohol phosphatidyltransferase family protein [Caulobacter sp. Root655]KRA56300.1 CDP-diacylglycerol--glycerol-3-phosphate 3-phosphatidyltransferase [Caulobacter sp. Root655]
MTDKPDNRRPLAVRDAAFARRLARRLADAKVSPDAISATSVAFALLGGALLMTSGGLEGVMRALVLVLAALCVQGRLLCNLLDGMVAVEHGQAGPAGPVWNELPDRVADVLLLAGAGYGAWTSGLDGGDALGWFAAVLAVLTAYVRELGRGLGQPADFSGPMAKQHRMAALTLTCAVSAVEPLWGGKGQMILVGLLVIGAGTLITVVRRTRNLVRGLRG